MTLAILIATALYLFLLAFCMHTKNLLSSILFKFIPFLLGVGILVLLGKQLGWLTF